ncbi:ScbR family autoregulator-binding transcription factor [Streptomyces sp. NPDC053750]|uniref:ScbR family autoregulator-binding transcription factor n=1 Tax=Streptomyces sp. NPDC053750 TaxID=3365714 RepID=UPI0037CFFB9D
MQERSERTRSRLVHAGAELFDRKGYGNASLLDIAGAAGVTKGALYFHFGSKEELADAVQQRSRSLVQQAVRAMEDDGRAPFQALIDLTHWLGGTLSEEPAMRAAFRIAGERADAGGRRGSSFHETCFAAALQLLERAREAGELRPGSPEGPETLIAAALCGIEVLCRTGMEYDELAARIGMLWDLMLPALVPDGAEGGYRTRPPRSGPGRGRPRDGVGDAAPRRAPEDPAGPTSPGGARPGDLPPASHPDGPGSPRTAMCAVPAAPTLSVRQTGNDPWRRQP